MKINLYLENTIYFNPSGLGNFIQVTPALKHIAEVTGRPVKVKFNKKYITDCFLDCDFIQWIFDDQEMEGHFPVRYAEWDMNAKLKDYEFGFREITGKEYDPKYHTYVDTPKLIDKPSKKYVVLMNGGNMTNPKNTLPKKMTLEMLDSVFYHSEKNDIQLIFLGSQVDFETTKTINTSLEKYCTFILGDMRQCLAYLNESLGVICNDTGLYHAACAMKKKVLVSDRVPIRPNKMPSICIQTPNENTLIVSEKAWDKEVGSFLSQFSKP